MKFLKFIALFMVLAMLLAFGVACDSGEGSGDESTSGSEGGTTAAPFIVTLTVIALDENGEEVEVIEETDAQYNGLKSTSELTIFNIVEDYCADNEIECTLDSVTGRLTSVGGYSVAEGGYRWTYQLDGEDLTDYDVIVANGAEIVITMIAVE